MISMFILFFWVLSGVFAADLYRDPASRRTQWVPMAAILGPFWFVVASEQREMQRHRADLP